MGTHKGRQECRNFLALRLDMGSQEASHQRVDTGYFREAETRHSTQEAARQAGIHHLEEGSRPLRMRIRREAQKKPRGMDR